MKWSDAYLTGVPKIDEQHRLLFKTVEELRIAVESGQGAHAYARVLGFLLRYCRDHFGFEERCMVQYQCPVAETNKAQHEALSKTLAEHHRQFTAQGYDQHEAQLLVDALEHWLHHHVARVDRQLRHCVPSARDS